MNNIFNLNRFILLFKKHTIEHAKTYLISIAVLAGILFLSLGFFAYINDGRLNMGIQLAAFVYCMVGGGCIFTSLSFTDLGDKRKATGLLTLPASHLEKYLVSWLYTYVIFQVLFLGVFYLIDFTIISIITPLPPYKNVLINVFSTTTIQPNIAFLLYALIHAFAIWGAIFFEKMHLIKTLLVFFICLILLTIINKPLLHLIGGKNITQNTPFASATFTEGVHMWSILPDNGIANFGIVILLATVVLIWISTFFLLKEKQI